MSIKLSDSIRVGQQKPLEDKYFNELVPYTSTTQVNTLIPKGVRHIGLTVNINKEEYWYKDGIEDSNLVLKITNNDIYDLKNQEQDDRLENLEGGLANKLDKGTYTGNASDLKSLIDTKADLENGKIPASQLPAYVDDVLEYANLAYFPATGESGKIYIAIDTNLTYRWGGSSYVVMSSSLALGETSSTAYRGDRGKIAYDHSQTTGNPHGTTKSDIGLGNVDNTSDLNKPISTATQQALNNKLDKGTYTGTAQDLYERFEGKNVASYNIIPKVGYGASGKVLDDSMMYQYNGKIGIGTNDEPSEKLDVNGNVKATSFIKSGGTSTQFLMADGSVSTITNNVTGAGSTNYIPKFTSSGILGNSLIYDNGTDVGIGSTSPLGKLHVVQNNTNTVAAIIQGGWFGALIQGGSAISNYALSVINSTSSSLLYVRGDGNVGIGTGSPSEKLDVNGNVKATAFYESSLRKLKENILPFESSGLVLISQLEIVTYDRKDGSVKDKIGIIADDSPEEFLSENRDSVDLYKTVFIQAKAIQELNAKNLELEERLIKLEKLLSNG